MTELFFGSDSAPNNAHGSVIAPPRSEWKPTVNAAKNQGQFVYSVHESVCKPVTVRHYRHVPVFEGPTPEKPSDPPPEIQVREWAPVRDMTPELLLRAYEIARDTERSSAPELAKLKLAIQEVLS